MNTPRLLHLMDYAPRGTRTIDHFILALARALRGRGWEVRFAFAAEPPAEFRAALSDAGAGWVAVPFPFTRGSARELVRRLAGFRPDVLQTSFVSPFNPAVLGLKVRGFARRLVVLDHASGGTPERRGWRRWAAQARGRLTGRVIDALLPVSHANARRAVDRVFLPAAKVLVVYNGIRLDLFPAPPRLDRDAVRVVYAGQLIPEKGVLTLLQADALLRAAGVAGYELLIAGTGPQEAELKAAARGEVRFLGHADDMPALFGSADVVVVPSVWAEAFGLVAAEAMACGAAVLVSDAGALAEVVGDAGRVFRAGDAADLAARLAELVADPALRRRLGAAGRERVEACFALDRVVADHVLVCEAVRAGRPLERRGQ